jgi:hypothetical protein
VQREYHRRNIIVPSWRLWSLAGLARRWYEVSGENYFAGIFARDGAELAVNLLWVYRRPTLPMSHQQHGDGDADNMLRRSPRRFHDASVPSWSWASMVVDGGLDWYLNLSRLIPPTPDSITAVDEAFRFVDVTYTPTPGSQCDQYSASGWNLIVEGRVVLVQIARRSFAGRSYRRPRPYDIALANWPSPEPAVRRLPATSPAPPPRAMRPGPAPLPAPPGWTHPVPSPPRSSPGQSCHPQAVTFRAPNLSADGAVPTDGHSPPRTTASTLPVTWLPPGGRRPGRPLLRRPAAFTPDCGIWCRQHCPDELFRGDGWGKYDVGVERVAEAPAYAYLLLLGRIVRNPSRRGRGDSGDDSEDDDETSTTHMGLVLQRTLSRHPNRIGGLERIGDFYADADLGFFKNAQVQQVRLV